MNKTEVYSWRITPHIKAALEHEARRERTSISAVLERITKEWIESKPNQEGDEVEQARLHAGVSKILGGIAGPKAKRAELAQTTIRKRLSRRQAR